jgi:hypothetical protein
MTAVDELIQKIAAKNGVMVGRDDPVMIVHTILELFQQTCATRKPHFSDRPPGGTRSSRRPVGSRGERKSRAHPTACAGREQSPDVGGVE